MDYLMGKIMRQLFTQKEIEEAFLCEAGNDVNYRPSKEYARLIQRPLDPDDRTLERLSKKRCAEYRERYDKEKQAFKRKHPQREFVVSDDEKECYAHRYFYYGPRMAQ